ncbi:MAG: deoxyguanosinetriphosphate triphosphohydrolase [Acidobacteriaceae bacterium]|nr:deoxyguanosinetriphosphate triphosphohydrolase [Acidobacteriaceae bacterium]
MLAAYAVRVEESRGRRYPEPPHAYRDDFQRDRDRVVHARAFRRLENKTQVFTRRYSDHFRNRLTHTIEVSQVARTIGAALGLNTHLVECLALVHDIGHPPFGHAGEKALDAAMRRHGEFFDHNLHALRIVDSFEQRYADFPGLNLTFEVREGIIKHSRDYSPDEFPQLSEYGLDLRPPLEAQLIDLADEIAYSTADLDDGCEAGLLDYESIRRGLPIFGRLYSEVESRRQQVSAKLKFNEALRKLMDYFVSDLIPSTRANVERSGVKSLEEVRRHPRRLVRFSDEAEKNRRATKEFLYADLYFSRVLEPEKESAERVISGLVEHWMERPNTLPRGYQEKAKHEPLARVVCDYIAGMTDNYILAQHRRVIGKRKVGVR